jgi:hypothetical protein
VKPLDAALIKLALGLLPPALEQSLNGAHERCLAEPLVHHPHAACGEKLRALFGILLGCDHGDLRCIGERANFRHEARGERWDVLAPEEHQIEALAGQVLPELLRSPRPGHEGTPATKPGRDSPQLGRGRSGYENPRYHWSCYLL